MAPPDRTPSRAKPRIRRDAEAAREAILDATEKRLVLGGPAGIRLQEVAAEAGVSHPTILHHFGSREALVRAVITRALSGIHADLVEAMQSPGLEVKDVTAMLNGVFEALANGGKGRVLMWLALEGHPIEREDVRLGDVVDAAHAVRKMKHRGTGHRTPPREDTAHTVLLTALALIGSAVLGPHLFENAGLTGDATGARFRAWLAEVICAHLDAPHASP